MFARIAACSLLVLTLAAGPTLAGVFHGSSKMGWDDMGSTANPKTPSGQPAPGSNGSNRTTQQSNGNTNTSNYQSGADCLNAATAAHMPRSACANLK
jgi:hypothetical protein